MAVIVVRQSVDTGEKIYLPGESIFGLNKKDEQELVDLGVCKFSGSEQNAGNSNELPDGLAKLGGGYYQLPDGSKVRGQDKAIAALAELNKSLEDDDELDDGIGSDGPDTELSGADA